MGRRKRASDAYRSEKKRGTSDRASDESSISDEVRSQSDAPREPRFEKSVTATPAQPAQYDAEHLAKLFGRDGGVGRAARLLIAMGSDLASRVLAELPPEAVERVTAEIIRTERFSRNELLQEPAEEETPALTGGPEVARKMLVEAFGEEEGERRFFVSVPNAPEHHFAFLNEFEPGQVHAALHGESPALIALVAAHIDPSLAAKLITLFEPALQRDVAYRIGKMGQLGRSTIVQVEAALREKIRSVAHERSDERGGTRTLTAILQHLGASDADALLATIARTDPELTETVKRELFTVDVLEHLSPRDLADLLREFDEREIALLLKGRSEELRAVVLRSVSERRAADISETFAHLGTQPKDEIDRVTFEVLDRLHELEREGRILVPKEGDRYI